MKKILFMLSVLATGILVNAQDANVIFFAEGGEKFTVTINGEKKNEDPQSNVKVVGLKSGIAYKANVVLEGVAGGNVSTTLYPNPGMEVSVNIKLNKKGKYVARFMGETPVAQSAVAATNPTPTPAPATNTNPVNTGTVPEATTTTTTTVTTSSTDVNTNSVPVKQGTGDSFSMNVNVNDETGEASFNVKVNDGTGGVSMNMNVNDANVESSTVTTTTTTSSSTTTSSGGYNVPANTSNTSNVVSTDARCDYPMDVTDFNSAKSSIESKSFSDSKMAIAKQVIKANCPTSVQIRDFAKLFTMDDDRLEVAKFAYDYCYDVANFYKVNDAFTFESTIEELNDFLSGK